MNQKALKTLEFNKIIDKLVGFAVSSMGKDIAANLTPSSSKDDIELWLKETSDATSCVLRKGNIPLGGLSDIRPQLHRASISGTLSIEELIRVADICHVSKKVKSYSKNESKSEIYDTLEPLFSGIVVLNSLENEITSKIISENEIADDASAELRSIRRNIRIANDRIKEQLNSIIHSQTYKNMLQDAVVTMRSGRYCVPVKQEYKNTFAGMVHDQSSTGATLFMEPNSVVTQNNKIRELQAKEKTEIEKILRELSLMVAEHAEALESNLSILIHLDFIFAKAQLSLSMNATPPLFNNEKNIDIKKGRHPLLDSKTVVPTDIYIGSKFTTLLITGPNTGGKTVALKTLGLFSLMGQAGLHIPAFDNSILHVFDNIFADIGDEQSIEQSLSTFSSHMSNIVSILDELTPNSLVLFDELGAGTDPTEGAALAMSILSYLHSQKIITAVTTHYSELKVYALSTEGVENASCEFDIETLRPTYNLLIGIPGKSNAFAISRKLGLPEYIIDDAKEFISHEDARFEDVITDLEISKKTVKIEQERALQYRREAEKLKKDLENQKKKIKEQKEKILLQAKENANRIMQKASDDADEILKQMRKQLEESNRKELEESRLNLKSKLNKTQNAISKHSQNIVKKPIEKLSIGDKVYITTFNQTGIVAVLPDKNGDVVVKAGIMKMKVPLNTLMMDKSEENVKMVMSGVTTNVKGSKSLTVSPEIDCRGQTVDEAIENIDKYLDDAYLCSLKKVTIIHGKGTGVLRTSVHQYLKKHPHIKSYRLGNYGEGEMGVTIAEIK